MRAHRLQRSQVVARPLDEVFAFFSDAANLERITPPWLGFRMVTPTPVAMRVGALIDYELRLRGIPLRWTSRIEEWEPGVGFVDAQVRGPYRLWHHRHRFAPHPRGTLVEDDVHYALPLGPLGAVALPLVRRDLAGIFEHRQKTVAALLG